MTQTNDPEAIARALRRYAPLRAIVKSAGPPPVQRRQPAATRYPYLVRAIVFQQLAGRAATAIHHRLIAACNSKVTPDAIDHLDDAELAACGLSASKALAIRDLTAKVDARIVRLDRHARMDDDEVVADLVQVRGIGTWTAHMYLMGPLGRGDVWPSGDYGVRMGWSLLHDLDPMITERALAHDADQLAPYRSAVAWYCWEEVGRRRAEVR